MRIVLFSDIHANLPALEACLAAADALAPDTTYCLGDLVGYNVWPNEVIRAIRMRGIQTIAGNYDLGIGLGSDDCGCAYKTEEEKWMGRQSIAYTHAIIEPRERAFLRTLPAHIRLTFTYGSQPLHLLLAHGSPRKVNEYLFEDRDEKSLLRILEQADADILCIGHTHKPYHRILVEETSRRVRYRHVINTGSVGKPKDGDPRGCLVLLHVPEDADASMCERLTVEFIRFPYDVERAAHAVEESPLPDACASMLRMGF